MIEPNNPKLSVAQQCRILEITRSTYYRESQEMRAEGDLEDFKVILEHHQKVPFYGYRKVSRALLPQHPHLTRKRVRRLMKRFGLRALYPGPNLSKARKEHNKYPYLLRGKKIRHPNQVWASDMTYIRLPQGHVYLVVILDLYSRKVLSWRLSNSMDPSFCVAALKEAIETYGVPAIFNTDQGSQFTSRAFLSVLEEHWVAISMDGVGRALDNVYVERLWRSLKYEDIYLRSYESMVELHQGIERYFTFYNTERLHQSLEYRTPEEMHQSFVTENPLPLAA
jgi:putative transposase